MPEQIRDHPADGEIPFVLGVISHATTSRTHQQPPTALRMAPEKRDLRLRFTIVPQGQNTDTMPTGPSETGRLRAVRGVNGWKIAIRLTTEPRAIRTARKLAVAAARQEGASDEDAGAIEVAIGEALANARQHAYGGGRGPVALDLVFNGRRGDLTMTIHDSGRPVTARPTLPAKLPPPGEGGRGLFVISRLMDGAEIKHPDRRGAGTAIRFVKRIRAPK